MSNGKVMIIHLTVGLIKKILLYKMIYFTEPYDLASLKSKIDKLDIGKLETTPLDLSKPSDLVKNEVVKKTKYDELVKKINAI